MRLLPVILALLLIVPTARAADPPKKDKELEDTVNKALAFLKNTQREDGSWSAVQGGGRNAAITGLCVMAFLSAGHVPGEGPYAETVEKGIRFVLKVQQANGLIAGEGRHEMYHHGICTLMLAEVAGMTEGPLADEVRKKLEKAVAVILKAQRKDGVNRGGWRYNVNGYDTDISVTGWQVMALRAAKNLGCDVPAEAIDRAVEYLKRCQDNGSGGFRYTPGGRLTVACTGTSILALEICGKEHHHCHEALRGGAYLIRKENLPSARQEWFFYSIYYGSQAAFQLGGNYWTVFRPPLHDVLLQLQRTGGFWDTNSADALQGGRAYCTAMAILALTVEYRFLPIYQRSEEPAEK